MQVQLRNVSDSSQNLENVQATENKQKANTQDGQPRVGKGAIPRIMAALNSAVNFVSSTLQEYKTAILTTTQSTSVQQNEIRLQNRDLISQMLDPNQPQPFPNAIDNATKQTIKDLAGISHKEVGSITSTALNNLSMSITKLETKLTDDIMTSLLTTEMKNILLKDVVVQNLKNELGTRGVPNDEGAMATLLMTKQYEMGALARTPNENLQKTIENLVTSMSDNAVTQRNYTQAKNEIQNTYIEAIMVNKDMTKQEASQLPELKELKLKLDQAALELEETYTTKNGGQLPEISLQDYREIFQGVAAPYLNNIGINATIL
ncbi:hypothetical protein K9U34_04835 [Lawsonia intracellularis]|uniref:NA n=1 Tax=Lawsonia intracellularis (strain PHE/MN1-00) TaxID=363253 RepID=Q1MPI7_LAWIP|nr:hypothetical protein [Lawsonia intracellularis]AGC50469.1 hypothetical protein LAW_01074 [Lawsonia intracellularis N343]MBZ3892917.1 hypothetical protein [Lawsonia intracellularis]OMQ02936.1 hypothetical protein BW722_05635 [Lawsonia intracellularis]RBN32926.1 hypothetical protein DR194_00585 [Lawsonia intracellularis]CAJ55090.1 NA [Lawsonia intracellularis PHE/MN1-00]